MANTPSSSSLVSKVWSYCNTLRDDSGGYGDYLKQLTDLPDTARFKSKSGDKTALTVAETAFHDTVDRYKLLDTARYIVAILETDAVSNKTVNLESLPETSRIKTRLVNKSPKLETDAVSDKIVDRKPLPETSGIQTVKSLYPSSTLNLL